MISLALAWVMVTAIKKSKGDSDTTIDVSAFIVTGIIDFCMVATIAIALANTL